MLTVIPKVTCSSMCCDWIFVHNDKPPCIAQQKWHTMASFHKIRLLQPLCKCICAIHGLRLSKFMQEMHTFPIKQGNVLPFGTEIGVCVTMHPNMICAHIMKLALHCHSSHHPKHPAHHHWPLASGGGGLWGVGVLDPNSKHTCLHMCKLVTAVRQ